MEMKSGNKTMQYYGTVLSGTVPFPEAMPHPRGHAAIGGGGLMFHTATGRTAIFHHAKFQ